MLFVFIKFAMVAFAYCACSVLNDLQVQRAAEVKAEIAQSNGGIVKNGIVVAWRNTGLGHFVDLVDMPETTVSYKNKRSEEEDAFVTVSTRFLLANTPLPGSFEYTITSNRVMEDNLQARPQSN